MSLTDQITTFVQFLKKEVCATAYSERTAEVLQGLADRPSGSVRSIAGLLYESDSSVPLSLSAGHDLGVAGVKPFGTATPQHYGAVGDGVADDTAALTASVLSGLPMDLGDLPYRFTQPLVATVSRVDWTGAGAVLLYAGAHVREAVKITCGLREDHRVRGVTFDAGQKANVAAKFVAATVAEDIDLWPNFYGSQIIARNAYRADQSLLDGDGLRVDGGFNHAEIDGLRVSDCFMAVGAGVFASQGVTGLTFGGNGARRCRNILLRNYHIENVWSEDPNYKFDQDGVRVFQETGERTSSCFLLSGTVKNVSGRAIKLHSAVNAVVDGLYRELDASVIPQSGEFSNPDIDAQQCPAAVSNIRFHYDGAWHAELVRNYTERPEGYRYGGATVSDISGRILNAPANAITVVALSGEGTVPSTKHIGAVSNIAIDGQIAQFISVGVLGTSGSNSVSLSNAVGEVTVAAVRATGTSAARLRVTASNLHNTRSSVPVPLTTGFADGNRELFVSGFYGFSMSAGVQAVGENGSLALNSVSASASLTGPNPQPNLIGATLIGFNIPTDATGADTDTVLLLQPTADVYSHTSGVFQLYRGVSASAGGATLNLCAQKSASSGEAAAHCTYSGLAGKSVELITCTFNGVQRIGVRMSGGAAGLVLGQAFFNGNYLGSKPLRLVPAAAVSGIAAFVQRTSFDQKTQFLQPVSAPRLTVGGVTVTSGIGSPEGVVSAPVGSIYTRTDGGAGTTLYIKETGALGVGWVAK